MSLVSQVSTLATRIATEFKTLRATLGSNASLATTEKGTLVGAINEVAGAVGSAGATINDTTPSGITVYSSNKTNSQISAATAALVGSAPGTLDTIQELSAALGDDPNAITSLTTAIGNRVRYDASQSLTGPQQTQARSNIGAGTSDLVIGTSGTTAAAGNDARLSDARTPTTHTHTAAQISDASTIGRTVLTAADGAAIRTAIGAGTSSLVIGTGAGQAADAAALATSLSGKAATSHTHAGADVAIATTTTRGSLEIATNAEVAAGTDATLAVVPTALKAVTDTLATTAGVGDTATNFVTTFEAALI